MPQHILIIEDEANLSKILQEYLLANGFVCDCLHDGALVQPWLNNNQTQLILLDLMLPNIDGLTLCKQFNTTPFIITTARVEEIDRLLGLELGADDYICKPYSPREVVARVKAVLRRQNPPLTDSDQKLQLHKQQLQASFGDRRIELTLVEFKLLATMQQQSGRIFSRQQLIDTIYDDGRVVSDRTIDSHIKKLRKKVQQLTASDDKIASVYGAGYKYNEL